MSTLASALTNVNSIAPSILREVSATSGFPPLHNFLAVIRGGWSELALHSRKPHPPA
jgi:hypothetical protein